jgi:hypothetical protein
MRKMKVSASEGENKIPNRGYKSSELTVPLPFKTREGDHRGRVKKSITRTL